MRLICPNCSAQYEVDAAMIPEEGRDVQCSNCGSTWFELPPPAAEPAEAADVEDPETPIGADAEPETASDDRADRDAAIAAVVAPPERAKRPRDVAEVDILKEEAAREIDRRRSEQSGALETQSELGLEPPRKKRRDNPSRALRARQARMKSEDTGTTDAPEDGDYRPPRRDLLPDIEEINSSLGPSTDRAGRSAEQIAVQRRGFRYGFVMTLGVAALAVLAYAYAPSIAEALPGSEQALLGYVDWANSARDALDSFIGQVQGG
ncbi:MAG: zinc-ribbon domain-containing protein [Pseudomonadota bacterium]